MPPTRKHAGDEKTRRRQENSPARKHAKKSLAKKRKTKVHYKNEISKISTEITGLKNHDGKKGETQVAGEKTRRRENLPLAGRYIPAMIHETARSGW